ncbi:hypothetical protein GCM10007913_40300 [Devosia yakushimensis]|uniref:Solute-binding protein family 3/N-terminal domain-containing protein n=1 Tax=Devosia yakushimensis TaxID=470028 RepID=A0ABQ5UJ79_9HYPH|nr:ABC transporter substrate-binding protein [Devosia yakushimensis]GLQ12098.1 hypothetical protein GCM10007913_40300 [Devosia yakushimensis]
MKLPSTLALMILSAAGCGAANSQEVKPTAEVENAGKLSISALLAYAPFGFVDEAGKPAGVDVDLANAVTDALGVELDITSMPFANMIPALVSGRSQVAWTTFSITPERLQQVDFVTYLSASTVFVTTAANAPRFPDQSSLCGATVAFQSGSMSDLVVDRLNADCAAASKPAIEKAIFPEQKDTIQAVLTGRVDGRLDDSTAAAYLETQSNGQLVVTPGTYFPTPIGIAVRKGDAETAEMMRSSFQNLIDSGEYAEILQKWNMSVAAIKETRVITDESELVE